MDLTKMTILTEADEMFDIDKEVDAQINRVSKRIEKQQNTEPQEDPNNSVQEDETENIESQDIVDNGDVSEQDNENSDSEDVIYDYPEGHDPNEGKEEIPEDYEPKQTIPELKILSTLSDSEYSLCNIRLLDDFKDLQKNTETIINNIIMTITTKNPKQRQVIDIVHNNLRDMIDDINNYILYRNNDIYEENVIAYLTYIKRYQIAVKLIRIIIEENSVKK